MVFLSKTMSSLYSNRSQSSGAPSGCGGTGSWHHACTNVLLSCRYKPMFPAVLFSESMPQDTEGIRGLKIQEELPSADDNTFNVFLLAHYS